MKSALCYWYKRYLSEPEAGILCVYLAVGTSFLMLFHRMLAPVLFSIVIAYLLEWGVLGFRKIKFSRFWSVLIVFILFIALFIWLSAVLLPLFTKQLTNLVNELPMLTGRLQSILHDLPHRFNFISQTQIASFLITAKQKLGHYGQNALSFSFTMIPNIVAFVVYLVMVPMLVYFFLMDKNEIMNWLSGRFVPEKRGTLQKVWLQMHVQIGNYVRAKVLEALIVGVITYITFAFMGLQYSLLLSALVGLSVLIPYIGSVVVTIPVVVVSLLQWGWSSQFLYLMIAYAVIIAVDGNLLVPLLFSEVISLNPVAIVIAVLFFGGLWGFWGIFFAIPLAALVKALIDYWPVGRTEHY